jgi:hypothetical protein
MLPGTESKGLFGPAWDPRADFSADEGRDCDCFIETRDGIKTSRHPESVLRDSPHLWDVVSKWRAGVARELSRDDYDRLTNFEVEAWLILSSAHSREMDRRMRAPPEE